MIYFVSGHLDLTDEEFKEHYVPRLEEAIREDGCFVVGDARGTDTLAQMWLGERGAQVVVFHMHTAPRNNPMGLPTQTAGTTDDFRDAAMTAVSHKDIAWVRPGREKSGTARNLARRAGSVYSAPSSDDWLYHNLIDRIEVLWERWRNEETGLDSEFQAVEADYKEALERGWQEPD